MAWLEITIPTAPGKIEDTAAALTAAGFDELILEDQQEYEGFLEQNRAYWDYIDEALRRRLEGLCRIRLYLEEDDLTSRERLKALVRAMGLTMDVLPLADTDWTEQSRRQYPPQTVGEKLVILPSWLAGTDSGGRLPVVLDPGLAFGTGFHPSTRMVLRQLERLLPPGGRCLDLGSGSGILSIAALRLGAGRALGVDIDPKAEDAARENAALNGYGEPEAAFRTGSIPEDGALMAGLSQTPWDLVLVNIVADVILALAPALPALAAPTGKVICSGILDARLPEVCRGLEDAGLTIEEVLSEEEWRCVTAHRR